jgi:uncharacterized protein
MRRVVVVLWLAVALTGVVLGADESNEDLAVVKKVVYDLKSGSAKAIEMRLVSAIISNATYYHNQLAELKAKVVIHGESYQFFLKSHISPATEVLSKKLRSLHDDYGVEFVVCEVGMKARNYPLKDLLGFVKTVPNATIGLIDAQNDGYAFVPLH